MKPEEVTEIVEKIGNAKSVKELDTLEFKELALKLREITFECVCDKLTQSEASAIIEAFENGKPFKAFKNLVSLRKGTISPSGQNTPSAGFLLENKAANIAWVYCYFI